MFKKFEFLEVSKRKLLGQGLWSCSVEELQEIGNQLEQCLKNIRARKTRKRFRGKIEKKALLSISLWFQHCKQIQQLNQR
ncbi:hypothetical protein SLEP1_g3566 [Rubroshorea leprosula]|uniref:K-box domain-containing protein n=1 Tax=Rubroshorea leprosula TaxID=152421 RepID=A0AAV5HV60_9ROSI|nr:hypothetical protein SLEP1_g3566 [Rubroshorea leprosula]